MPDAADALEAQEVARYWVEPQDQSRVMVDAEMIKRWRRLRVAATWAVVLFMRADLKPSCF
ncbi:hypothetical protein [Roseateles sp.]|uniref:hypothetical protein n=1 Tax=Roseateles sp. TaxID=1971397 RepID=UPI00326368CF